MARARDAGEPVVSGALSVQRIGERIIRSSCRQFAADVGADRCREWTAELSAILDDASIRSSFLRALRALAFCAGIARTTRQLSRPARADARTARHEQWRTGAPRARPGAMAVRVAVGLAVWLLVVAGLVIATTVLTASSPRSPGRCCSSWRSGSALMPTACGTSFAPPKSVTCASGYGRSSAWPRCRSAASFTSPSAERPGAAGAAGHAVMIEPGERTKRVTSRPSAP